MIQNTHPLPWRAESQRAGGVTIVAANGATVATIADIERATVIVRAVNALPMLRAIAYPRRGTHEEHLDAVDMAKMVQRAFTIDDLRDVGEVRQ